jgi:hypothetical protein
VKCEHVERIVDRIIRENYFIVTLIFLQKYCYFPFDQMLTNGGNCLLREKGEHACTFNLSQSDNVSVFNFCNLVSVSPMDQVDGTAAND